MKAIRRTTQFKKDVSEETGAVPSPVPLAIQPLCLFSWIPAFAGMTSWR